ncbi:class I SAM-dependent methyltransferase [Georgenia daeguensis]|uniref:Methyltransferase domain-containing protein n=1 Tax=Georgenia daeguensis TaxID=908355 RepID=A0ABP8EUN5_9MICO
MARVPTRIDAAIRHLDPAGTERVLEIGGGTGVAVEILLDTFPRLTCTAVDRSARAVDQTRRRNARFVEEGRLTVVEADVADLTAALGADATFDLALAVNVNVFWTRQAVHEAGALAAHLRPGGRLCLVYELPDGRRPREDVADRVVRSLDVPGLRTAVRAEDGLLVVTSRRDLGG